MRNRSAAFVALLLTGIAFAADADERRPITHEDVWLMKRVGAPALSPDGRWVVIPVAEPAYSEDEKASDLWIVPADGSMPPRRLTSTRGAESGTAWSPDSTRIAFAAKRDGDEDSQIYVLDIAGGGEAQRVTNIATGATRPLWRPDSQAILFTSMVFPGAMSEIEGRRSSQVKKRRMRSEPRTNSGSEMIASEVIETAWSAGRPARTAATTPKRSESGIMSAAVIAARMKEFESLPWISLQIGSSPPWA